MWIYIHFKKLRDFIRIKFHSCFGSQIESITNEFENIQNQNIIAIGPTNKCLKMNNIDV